jgi:hypothetical protein
VSGEAASIVATPSPVRRLEQSYEIAVADEAESAPIGTSAKVVVEQRT